MTSPDGINWTTRTSPNTNSWFSVAHNGQSGASGLWVAVANSGTGNRVMTSPDGITWTIQATNDNQWFSVTYGNGLFVAVAISGGSSATGGGSTGITNRVMTSPDGINWTTRTATAAAQWIDVTFANDLFVAVANNLTANRVMTSPDGINWTARVAAVSNPWRSVTYGNGMWVAVSDNGTGNRVMTSPDGITWTSRTSAADNAWRSVTYANGLFVAVAASGTGNRVMTSPDGVDWTIRSSAADFNWQVVEFANGLFVAVANSGAGNRVMTSPDGINWTLRNTNANRDWHGVAYGNGRFVAVAQGGTQGVMTSTDGLSWTLRQPAEVNSWRSVAFGNGVFVAVGSGSQTGGTNHVMRSTDGINWTAHGGNAVLLVSVTYGGGQFVAVGSDATTANTVMTSPDGINWTTQTAHAGAWHGVAYGRDGSGNGLYVAVANNNTASTTQRVMTSPDGITWTLQNTPTYPSSTDGSATADWRMVAYGSGRFVAAATNGGGRLMSSGDGVNWALIPGSEVNTWRNVTFAGGTFVAVGQSTGTNVAMSPDGVTWTYTTEPVGGWWSVTYGAGRLVAVRIDGDTQRAMSREWASQIAVNGGNTQSVPAGTAVATAPSVIVRDANNNPVAGVAVAFAVASGGGSITGANATTNALGIATVGSWTLGTTAGANSLTATVDGLTGSPVTFTATGTGSPTQLSLSSPADLTAGGSRAAYTVTRRDVNNNATTLGGALTVYLSVSGSSGVFYDAPTNGTAITSVTIPAGQSSADFHFAATTAATYSITASDASPADGSTGLGDASDGISVAAGAATQMAIHAGNNQTATVGTAVPVAPAVIVRDVYNNPVSGVSVNFAVASGAGSVTQASATTDASGIASPGSWTLGTTAGTNTLTATSTGLSGSPLTFTATGQAGAATQMAIHAGNNQTATVATAVPVVPAVIVRDVYNNPVAGVSVNFAVASGAGSITGASATTDAAGIASPGSWTLGTTAGTNTLTATITGTNPAISRTFTAEAISRPAKPTQLSASPSDRQISISFTPAADGGTAITNYEYSLDEGLSWIAFSPAKTSSTLIITGLNNGTRYPVQIRALNSVGAGTASDVVYATPSKSIADLSVSITNVTYTGQQQQVKPTIKDGLTTLTENTDYTLSYSNNINAGTAGVSISGINRYSGVRQESFSISPASLSITADAKSKVYGQVNPTLSYTYTGLVNGETKIATEPTISTTANTSSGVGKYPISLSGGTDPNYTIRLIDAELTVTAATLSITADAKSKIFGRADPVFTYQVSGLKLNEREADVLSGTLTRQAGENPGTYTISQGTLSANANYTISFTAAELSITAAQILSFVDLGIIETAWGRNPTLPAQVQVLTTNGQFIPMDISWNTAGLNIFARGVQVISGSITLSNGIVNPLGVRPTATIRVLPKPAPQNLTLSNNSFEGSTIIFNIAIGRLIVIDPVDAVHTLSLAPTVADNRYFTIINNVLYWNSPDRAEGKTSFIVRVTLTDRDGNRIEKEFEIIRTRKTLQSIQIPNTFTPNGDGVNDTWGVAQMRFFQGASIQIFERSGQRLFLTQNPDTGWDGTRNGTPLPAGTYYWIIQVKETGEIRKGVLNLIR